MSNRSWRHRARHRPHGASWIRRGDDRASISSSPGEARGFALALFQDNASWKRSGECTPSAAPATFFSPPAAQQIAAAQVKRPINIRV